MSKRKGTTTVASRLNKERIWINRQGQIIDRDSKGKKKMNEEVSREDEISNLKARLKELEGDE